MISPPKFRLTVILVVDTSGFSACIVLILALTIEALSIPASTKLFLIIDIVFAKTI